MTKWNKPAMPRGKALAGWILLGCFVVMALIGPYVAPYNPSQGPRA